LSKGLFSQISFCSLSKLNSILICTSSGFLDDSIGIDVPKDFFNTCVVDGRLNIPYKKSVVAVINKLIRIIHAMLTKEREI